MVGGAILAGVALGGAQLFKDQKTSQKGVEHSQDLSMFHQRLAKNLSAADNCNATLSELYPSAGNALTPIADVPRIARCTAGCLDNNNGGVTQHTAYSVTNRATLLSKSAFIDTREIWQVRNIAIIPNQDPATGIPIQRTTSGPVILRITYAYNPKLYPVNTKLFNKDIILNTRFNDNGFRECINSLESSTNNLQNDFCKTLNYGDINSTGAFTRWDESTQTCVFGHRAAGGGPKRCDTLGTEIAGFNDRGFVQCRNIVLPGETTNMVAPSPVPQTCLATQKPIINYDSVNKQVIIQCVN